MRLKVYHDIVMYICEAWIQYRGIDDEGPSPMTAGEEIQLRLNQDFRKIVKSTES